VVAGDTSVLVHNDSCGVRNDVIAETQEKATSELGAAKRTSSMISQYSMTADEALETGEAFVGDGYTELGQAGSGVFRSADGLRGFRIDGASLDGGHWPGVPHVHLEAFGPSSLNKPIANNHVALIK
jgi:hypothetical protein